MSGTWDRVETNLLIRKYRTCSSNYQRNHGCYASCTVRLRLSLRRMVVDLFDRLIVRFRAWLDCIRFIFLIFAHVGEYLYISVIIRHSQVKFQV